MFNIAEIYIRLAGYQADVLTCFSKAVETSRVALQLSIKAGDSHLQARSLCGISKLECQLGNIDTALSTSYKAYSIAQSSGNPHDQVSALTRQCICHVYIGQDFRKASICIDEALALLIALDMQSHSAYMQLLNYRSHIYLQKTEYQDARDVHQAILENLDFNLAAVDLSVEDDAGDTFHACLAFLNIVEIDTKTGDADHCDYDADARLDIVGHLLKPGNARLFACCEVTRGNLYLSRKQYDLAQSTYQQVLLTDGRRSGKTDRLSFPCYEGLFRIALWKGDSEMALQVIVVYLLEGRHVKAWPAIHRSLRCLGEVLLIEGDTKTAEVLLNVALEGSTFSDIHRGAP